MFNRSKSELEMFAHRAGDAFIASGIPLSDSVTKLAADNNLSREQIRRVCEFSNHYVNEYMLKNASSRFFEFPLANAESVIGSLGTPEESFQVPTEYDAPPKIARKICQNASICIPLREETKIDKTAAKQQTLTHLRELYATAQHCKTAAVRKSATVREDMYKMINKMVDSGYKLEDLYMAAKTASQHKETVTDLFKYVVGRMKDEGRLERAIKISLRKLSSEEDLSGADGSLGKYPVGDHQVKVVLAPGTLEAEIVKLEESQSDAVKADAAMGHISSMIDTVKSVKE